MRKRNFSNSLGLLLLKYNSIGLLLLTLCQALCSCGSDFEYDNRHQCHVVIDNSFRLDPTLTSAMNQMAPGTFCRIWLGSKGGAETFFFESNHGLSSSFTLNDVERQRTRIVGIYNESGIIVGYGTLDTPATFYAYDAQCPNCYEQSHLPQARLSMSGNGDGKATCQKCKRQYDMNNGGLVVSGEGGRKLFRYHSNNPTPQGVLSVTN